MSRSCSWPSQWIDLRNPRADDIDLSWLATRMSLILRFNGGTREPYSIAQHSVWVTDHVSNPAKPYALLHDGHEGFIGDVTRPCADALDDEIELAGLTAGVFTGARNRLAERIDQAIFAAAGLEPDMPRAIRDEIAAADDYAGALELTSLVDMSGARSVHAPRPVSADLARSRFIEALRHYTKFRGE